MPGSDQSSQSRAAFVSKLDEIIPSPSARAQKLLNALRARYGNSLDTWDVTCFAAEWLGLMSLNPELSFLEPYAKRIGQLVYTAHYERFKHELDPKPAGASPPNELDRKE